MLAVVSDVLLQLYFNYAIIGFEVIAMFTYDTNTNNCVLVDIENHDDYISLINALQQRTKYVVIVQIHGIVDKNDKHLLKAKQSMRLTEKSIVTRFFSTWGGESVKYVFERDDNRADFFKYLKEFNTFFDDDDLPKVKEKNYPQKLKRNFGIDDIGFLDTNKKVLFFTVTHEHMACIDKGFLNKCFQ